MYKKTLIALIMASAFSVNAQELQFNQITEQGISIGKTAQQAIFSGVASFNDPTAGTVSVVDNNDGTVNVSFSEWPYLDGLHLNETVSTFVLDYGRHLQSDGSIWEVGVVDLNGSSQMFSFSETMPQVPYVFLTGQTRNGVEPYTARASHVTRLGFNAQVQYQESSTGSEVNEKVAYLSVYAPNSEGRLDSGISYKLNQVKATDQITQAGEHDIFLHEEQSKDTELTHTTEVVNVLELNGHLFAQDITTLGSDTMTIRANLNVREPEAPEPQSCQAILNADPSAQSGYYTLDVDGRGGLSEFTTYCDMEYQGGGWTLVSIRFAPNKNYDGWPNDLTGFMVEAQNITSLDDNYHLPDAHWQYIKDTYSELMMTMPTFNGAYAIADIAVLKNANCVPLQDTLGLIPGETGERSYRLFWHENSGCSGSGSDYSMLNYQNIYGYSKIYKSTNIVTYVSQQTSYVYVR
ncbi:fibrinogen-like YCDxxxxGGGW domain-containing protein [Pseudoalteromonas sp. OOF1S-7]|uniref:fibrinogen-like YCDxxxxGGGW domain-containing protein n=1 Tax=Pseudoalteromonas sp. OOF1S-7 TaxID=2917757 RepID=UPI001EF56347|nr:fibrinogen-like YCDxxxxGGGW domain-containing protein [Pseudoalteromonas sp. OOF1S-7]MCG7535017.1 hypothetical protein [Pseudoalteromonas sp. OOF1S-7]